ncbi:hypothetical protein STPH1_7353 [Streptomyces sp. OM5714]|nr:hypothetical protein STPH1_7353 [Streptomyces sp. OM5714]
MQGGQLAQKRREGDLGFHLGQVPAQVLRSCE